MRAVAGRTTRFTARRGGAAGSLPACEGLDAMGRPIRGLLVVASNVLVPAPDAMRLAGRLPGSDLLGAADMFLSAAAPADVVLPITQWAEEEGTMTNPEGRVLLRRRAKAPPPGMWTELEMLHAPAAPLGCTAAFAEDPGTAEMPARRRRDIRADVVFVPFHWGGRASANRLTNAVLHPVAKMPEFKACAVRAEKPPVVH